MNQLSILSGAGINLGVSKDCPFADELINFTYQKVSHSVYKEVDKAIQEMFSPDSFDYILGGLLTINLAIERTKNDLRRFKVDENSFSKIFKQTELQQSINQALETIEKRLTISLGQMLDVLDHYDPAITEISKSYDSINYFTLNFDGIFDHIIYGKKYKRGNQTTDFWNGAGELTRNKNAKFKIYHLHGDLRYKPSKRTSFHTPPYQCPVLVVGDSEVKRGIIGSNDSLTFYNNKFSITCKKRAPDIKKNILAIIGFGFRDEDVHIIKLLNAAFTGKTFDHIYIYDIEDKLKEFLDLNYTWVSPGDKNLRQFLLDLSQV